jgi:hypothetical protein
MNGSEKWSKGCEEFIADGVRKGWEPYYVNFIFEAFRGTPSGIMAQMHKWVCNDFYRRFCLEFVHHPRARGEQARMPSLWLFPDKPVFKGKKTSLREITINAGGLHLNGPMLIPPISRFREDPIAHIMQGQRYAGRRIRRIHVEHIKSHFERVSDYAVKTMKWGRADPDDILILPRTPDEMTRRSRPSSPGEKAIKDIQSAFNVSDEVAGQIYTTRHADASGARR